MNTPENQNGNGQFMKKSIILKIYFLSNMEILQLTIVIFREGNT